MSQLQIFLDQEAVFMYSCIHGHSGLSNFLVGLLQCTLRRATLEKHSNTEVGPQCGSASSFVCTVWPLHDTIATQGTQACQVQLKVLTAGYYVFKGITLRHKRKICKQGKSQIK